MKIGETVTVEGVFLRVPNGRRRQWLSQRCPPQKCVFLGYTTLQDGEVVYGDKVYGDKGNGQASWFEQSRTHRAAMVMPLNKTGEKYRKPFPCPPEGMRIFVETTMNGVRRITGEFNDLHR